MSHKFKEVTFFLEKNAKCSFFWKQILIISAMSVVGYIFPVGSPKIGPALFSFRLARQNVITKQNEN